MQTGNGWERIEEDRTNFGALAITSSPLILGMDVTNAKALARVWHMLTNREAIAINQMWAGSPGRMISQKMHSMPTRYPRAVPCDGSPQQNDWELGPPSGPNRTRAIMSKSTKLCVDAWQKAPLTMEPCTGNASQQFVHDEATGTIKAPGFPANNGQYDGCFDIEAKIGPTIQLTSCYECEQYPLLLLDLCAA